MEDELLGNQAILDKIKKMKKEKFYEKYKIKQ